LLGGCAAENAFREGQGLAADGRMEEAMVKYQEAMTLDPKDVQYKVGYVRARERAISSYVERADREATAGRADLAQALYRRALALDRGNERANAGLRALEAERRNARAATGSAVAPAAAAAVRRNGDDADARTGDSKLSVAYKKPISIEFRDVTLKQLFEVVSRSSGLNFLFDKDVRSDQKTTVFLKNSTVESVVYFTLLTNQLEQQVLNENTILIYPNTPNKQKDYQELMVRTFHLANTDAKMVANTLKTILKTRDVVVDDKLNMLIVRDSPEAIRLASRLVALHDVPEPEVMLEVEILEVKRDRLLNLGIAWPDSLSLTPIPSATGGVLTLRDLLNTTSSTLAAGIGPVTINAGNTDSSAKLLANPRIRARNHEKAKILIGDRVPLITTTSTATGFASESINYIDVGLKLDVEPAVHLDNDVAIKVSLEVSNIVSQLQTKSGSVAYQIGTRTASTTLRLRDGENQVLAGLISDEDRRNAKKIPGFGDLPVLGRLFGNSVDENHNTEIVLSITPHLIRNIERPEPAMLTFAAGTENSLRLRPDGPTLPASRSPLIALSGQPAQGVPPGAAGPAQVVAVPVSMPAGAGAAALAPATAAQDEDGDAAPAAGPTAPPTPEAPTANAQGSAQLHWDGAQQLKVGDTFTLQLSMQSGRPVTSVPVAITFDDKVFQAGGVVEGSFLRQGGAPTSFTSKVDTAGQLLITGTRTDNSGASGSGNFASINFRALAPANASAIQLLTAAPVGLKGSAIPAQAPAPHVVQVQP
jgi:general secretion pathway protein D